MALAAKLDELGKAGWIALTILGFLVFWPVGFGLLGFLICSGRLRAWRSEQPWRPRWEQPAGYFRHDPLRGADDGRAGSGSGPAGSPGERRDYQDFLERLRHARDIQRSAG